MSAFFALVIALAWVAGLLGSRDLRKQRDAFSRQCRENLARYERTRVVTQRCRGVLVDCK